MTTIPRSKNQAKGSWLLQQRTKINFSVFLGACLCDIQAQCGDVEIEILNKPDKNCLSMRTGSAFEHVGVVSICVTIWWAFKIIGSTLFLVGILFLLFPCSHLKCIKQIWLCNSTNNIECNCNEGCARFDLFARRPSLRNSQSVRLCCRMCKSVLSLCVSVCVSVCCRLLPSVAVCCRLLPSSVAVCVRLLPSVAVCCRLLPSVAVCCHLLPSVAFCCRLLSSVAVCCRLLPSVAVCCPCCRLRLAQMFWNSLLTA